MLVSGVIPRAAPSKELLETTKLLRNIANNINQVARIANRNGSLDTETYQSNYADLLDTIDQIMLMMHANSIRDVIAFPKNSKAVEPLTAAPGKVSQQQLDDLKIEFGKDVDYKLDK